MTATTAPRRGRRFAALVLSAALAGAIAPVVAEVHTTPAFAAGDVCDICSVNFDLGACETLGGYPYDSTLESPPAAISNPKPAAPAPAAPAPAAPAAPAPAAPAAPNTTSGGATETAVTQQGGAETAVVATAPVAPTALAQKVAGRTLTLSWTAPADGGAALTGYKLILNGGSPIVLPADATTYDIALGAGSYEASLIATNSVGDSVASETLTGIEIVAASASPKATAKTLDAEAAADAAPTPIAGILTLGGLAVVGGALLAWWWIRRKRTASAPPVV